MAIVLVEGFDHYDDTDAAEKFWNGNIFRMDPGRGFGGQCIEVIPNNPVYKILPASYSTIIVGAALKITGPGGHSVLMELVAAGVGVVGHVSINADQTLAIVDTDVRVTSGTTIVPFNRWFYIEYKVITGAAGSGELHLNGAPEIPSTTGNYTPDVNEILFTQTTARDNTLVDDVVVLDDTGGAPQNDFLGDVRVETLYPLADGTYTDWTPKVGTDHFAMVNEHIIDGDGSFVYDANPGDKDSYILETFIQPTIYAAQLNIGARKGDAALRQLAPLIRQGGVDYLGSTVTLSTSDYVFYSWLLTQDPTGADWLAATINADEFGMQLIA